MAPRKKNLQPESHTFVLSDAAKKLIYEDQQKIAAARDALGKTLITLSAGAGVPQGSVIQEVDLERGLITYTLPLKTPLEIVKDGPKE